MMVHPDSDRVSRAPPYSGYSRIHSSFRLRDYHPLSSCFPAVFSYKSCTKWPSYNTVSASTDTVWAVPVSLAATQGISFDFFSSGYLDVSVLRVGFLSDIFSSRRWVPPFGHLRINGRLHLPATFRSLSRPSSPA